MSGFAVLAIAPALPLHEAGKYVAAAYIVAFLLVLIYVAIMAIRLARVERELGELIELSQGNTQVSPSSAAPAGSAAPASSPADTPESQLAASHSEPVGVPSE